MLRVLGILVTVLFAIATAVVSWPQFFRVERVFPIAQIVSVRPVLVVVLAAIALLFLLLCASRAVRGFAASMVIVALAGAVVNGFIVADRGIGAGALPAPTDTSLRVMTWNTEGDGTPAQTIAQTAVTMDADIISLPETSVEIGAEVAVLMKELGRPMWVHHVQFNPDVQQGPIAWQTTILISPTLGDYSVIESSTDGTNNTGTLPSVVAMPVDGDGPIVVAVHAIAPRPDAMDAWNADLQWIADQCVDGNVILAGDFNATVDHMFGLGIDGGDLGHCHDAATEAGSGAVATWPTKLPSMIGAPIDHVMATGNWRATGATVLTTLDDAGSDHRPVVVQLEPAG